MLDPNTIAEQMIRRGFGEHDTIQLLAGCMEVTPTAANVREYCRLVKEASNRRKLRDISFGIADAADNHEDCAEITARALELIDDIKAGTNGTVLDGQAMASSWIEHMKNAVVNPGYAFCSTGFKSLDKMLGGGMFKQGMYIIGARPGMGKTTLGIAIAEQVAAMDKPVLFVSMEMSDVQIMSKRIARHGRIGYTKLISGRLSELEQRDAVKAATELSQRPMSLSCESRVTVSKIGTLARQIKGLQLIVVDYLGLIRPPDDSKGATRYEQMTGVSADLKALAKRLGIPIVVLCQLNRNNTTKTDKRPELSDLRDTGAIEQDADAAIMLHREAYYDTQAEKTDQETIELIVAKNRHGGTGKVEMCWFNSTGLIGEIDNPQKADELDLDRIELPF